jgi:hypothetical protein
MPTKILSSFDPLALIFTLLMGGLMIMVKREYVVIPLLITAIYITLGQVIVIAGLHFTMLRIMILFGWVRIVVRGELSLGKLNAIDKCILFWVISSIVIYTIQRGTGEALVNQLGLAYNSLGLYFLFRFLIRDMGDIKRLLKVICVIIVPLTIAMSFEWMTGKNVFSVFGGVSAISIMREGWVRCQGSFTHPIIAGTFAATAIPMLAALWFQENIKRWLPFEGVASVTLIVFLAHSSGPIITYLAIIVSFMFWPLRTHMRAVRWGMLFGLIILHLVMKAPIWFLIGRLSNEMGGDGWHRSELIDAAIQHLDEWWLIGTQYTIHWMPFSNEIESGMADITNQYVFEGIKGGLGTLVLFIAIIALSFRAVGLMLKAAKEQPFSIRIMIWSMGAALVGHVVSFLSVSYFDQILVFWYFLLAAISSLSNLSFLKADSLSSSSR